MLRTAVADSPQLHELLHEWQRTGYLPDRGAIGVGTDAERHRLSSVRTAIFGDELVRQRVLTESFGDAAQRGLVGHGERDDDRLRVARGLGSGVCCLSDLRTVWEVSPN